MKPAPFEYFAPATVGEAAALLHDLDDAKVLAGGQSLVPAMNFRLARPAALVDINRVAGLDTTAVESGSLTIGALVRHRSLEDPVIDGPLGALLAIAARYIGHLPIRVRGTFAGSLAHADPASEWCVIARTLDAEMTASSVDGERLIAAADFFQTIFTTDLRSDELLTHVRIPLLDTTHRVGFSEFSRRAGDFALLMAAVVIRVDGDTITEARIGIGGASDRPLRATEAEMELVGRTVDPRHCDAAAQIAAASIEPLADIHASAEYRRDLVRAMTRRALGQALTP
ncbi:MAG: xanthine dehydrogenase family protein subunit M [Acidimicrobiia bacterium]|nr:xanthine dehydrogenase family protein subunit M [Acidimicrobiia bacterium]